MNRCLFKANKSEWDDTTKNFFDDMIQKNIIRERKDGTYVLRANIIDERPGKVIFSIFNESPMDCYHSLLLNDDGKVVSVDLNISGVTLNKFKESKELLTHRIEKEKEVFELLKKVSLEEVKEQCKTFVNSAFAQKSPDTEHVHGSLITYTEKGHGLKYAFDAYKISNTDCEVRVRVSYSSVPGGRAMEYTYHMILGTVMDVYTKSKESIMYNIIPSENEDVVTIVSNGFPVVKIHRQFDLGASESYEEISRYLDIYLQNYNSLEEAMTHFMTCPKDATDIPEIVDNTGLLLEDDFLKRLTAKPNTQGLIK